MPRYIQSVLVPVALLCLGAAPAAQVIPHPEVTGEALLIPHDSLVRFRGFDQYGVAHFRGQFVLTGTFFIEGCPELCPGAVEDDLTVNVFPDSALEARLPHWKVHNNDILMTLKPGRRLLNIVTSPRQRAALLTGKASDFRGHISIVVDEFQTSLECDSANFSARFVAMAKAPRLAQVNFNGNYGCA